MSDLQNKKGLRNRTILVLASSFLICMLFFILPPFANAETYNTSSPIIEVNYLEIPVDILDYNLTDVRGTNWSIYNMSGLEGDSIYNFTISYIDNGDYTFYVFARDIDGNEVEGYKYFTIDHGGLGVWLIRPKPAIGKTPTFNITVGTQFVATCKYSTFNPPNCNQTCRYAAASDEFDETGDRTEHTIVDYPAPQYVDIPLYVVCRSDVAGVDLGDERNFGSTNFMVGYDTVPPTINSAYADPNPVVDANWRQTTVFVETNEPTICRINGGNPNFPPNGVIDQYFSGTDPSDYGNYTTLNEINISYIYIVSNNNLNLFMYNITCYDRANWSVQRPLNVIVHLNDTLEITQVTPSFVGQRNIDYEIRTNVMAQGGCSLSQDGGVTWLVMEANPSSNYRNFTRNIDLQLGENDIKVFCISGQPAYADFTITVDDVDPEMQLLMYEETCSLTEINFEMNATDEGTGIDFLNYSVWHGNEVLQDWTATNDPTRTYTGILLDGETYTVKANAFDNAGRQSNLAEASIVAHGSNSPNCDITSPTATVTFVGSTYQKNVTVTCQDNAGGTGCREFFDYEKIPGLTGSCVGATYPDSMSYSNLPLLLFEDTFLCVRVSDQRPNYGYANSSVAVQTIVCGNNVVDPGEACDGTQLSGFACEDFGFDNGILSCNPPGSTNQCGFNTDNCGIDPYGYCGDNIINNFFWEQCDGNTWGGISHETNMGCQQFGFNSGTLTCNPSSMPKGERCMFNTSQCVKTPPNNVPNCDGTSGGVTTLLDPSEQCEIARPFTLQCSDFDSFGLGEITCTDACMFDISGCEAPLPDPVCNNSVIEPGETCDPPGSLRACDTFPGYTGGNAVCQSDCSFDFAQCMPEPICGDNERTGLEQCDGNDLGNMKCEDIGINIGGTLSCYPPSAGPGLACTFDERNCDKGYGYCGDNLINNPFLEQCDGLNWGNIDGCADFGFTGGTLNCYSPFSDNQCLFDTSSCTGFTGGSCGDRILQVGEQCERDRPFTVGCSDFDSFTEGTLSCDYSTCMYNIGNCRVGEQYCGDGVVQSGETCDINDFGDLNDCSDIRPTLTGPLSCFPRGHQEECQIDISSCSAIGGGGFCGNNIVDLALGEQCDGTDINGLSCNDLGFIGGTLGCYASGTGGECTFNTQGCIPEILTGWCGDGELNTNEVCDPGIIPLPITCFDIDNSQGGTLSCIESGPDSCTYDTSDCTPPPEPGYCGDGTINNFEKCDGTNLGGMTCERIHPFIGGILGCYPSDYPDPSLACTYDKSRCDSGYGYCGDNVINDFPNEQCDGNDWGNIQTCRDLNSAFVGGNLKCTGCWFDTSECNDGIIATGSCGDNIVHTGEQCDPIVPTGVTCSDFDHFNAGSLSCVDCDIRINECYIEPDPNCGNGVIDQGEQCETGNLGGSNLCSVRDPELYSGGTISCNAPGSYGECFLNYDDCDYIDPFDPGYCGDEIANGDEECDGSDLGEMNCSLIDTLSDGVLRCNADCTFNTDNCNAGRGWCGDNIINNFPNEQCDGLNWGNIDGCSDFGFAGGALSCNNCQFVTSACTDPAGTGNCGNQILNIGEQCELNRPMLSCTDFDAFVDGTIACNYANCRYDISGCEQSQGTGYCGDGLINDFPNEECDGTNWGNVTSCSSLNPIFIGGTLSCYAPGTDDDCTFNTNSCISDDGTGGYCGDGRLVPGESCEEGVPLGSQCTTFDAFIGGDLGCHYNNCTFDLSDCETVHDLYCGDGVITPGLGEVCDGEVIGPITECSVFDNRFISGQIGCTSDCQYDLSDCVEPDEPICGDGSVNAFGEQCDGSNLGGATCADIGEFIGGTLSCFSPGSTNGVPCMWDTQNCNLGHGYCGDGFINNLWQEQCDGTNWGNIEGCADLGFTGGGTLSCYPPFSEYQCLFNTNSCIGLTGGFCGDKVLQIGEQCETDRPLAAECRDFDSFVSGPLACDYSTCFYDLFGCMLPTESYCGDGQISGDEECDGTNLGDNTQCTQFGNRNFIGGTVGCHPPNYPIEELRCTYDLTSCIIATNDTEEFCGDGLVNDFPNEICDMGTNGVTCQDLGYAYGDLSCIAPGYPDQCSLNKSLCYTPDGGGVCGNGIINNNEECEPGESIGITCQDLGFLSGTLSCNAAGTPDQCEINIDNCVPAVNLGYCGDGYIISDVEWCDSNNLGGLDCTYFDNFIDGILGCDTFCNFDTSNCDIGYGHCGDGMINNPFNEQCDGDAWGGVETCADFGFNSGTLGCYGPEDSARCTFDTSQCYTPAGEGPCGNSVLNIGEQCEIGMAFDLGCSDFDGYIGGTIDCDYSTCQYILDGCTVPSVSVCGDGFISGNEQCDGLNLGPTTLCTELDDEFTEGSITCYPSDHRRACRFDVSACKYVIPPAICGNDIVEGGEECDGTENFLTCEDFGLGSGFLGCDDCSVNTTSCTGTPVLEQICGNTRLEPSEECDGTVDALFTQSFAQLYSCEFGVGCSDSCTIDCLSQVLYTCDNLIRDGDETGFNCGGSCPACAAGESCIANSDCQSGRCLEGICQEDQCMNGILDGDETGTDCGGSCPACGVGESCFGDYDCQSGKCVDGVCMPSDDTTTADKPNTAGIILIIIGLLLMLGGGGYVIYEEYFDKKKHAPKTMPLMTGQQKPLQPSMMIDPKILEMQKKKQEERRQQQQDARKSLLEGFDKESTPKDADGLETLKEKKVNKEILKEAGYIDMTEEGSEGKSSKKSSSAFDKLKKIGNNEEIKDEKIGLETYDVEDKKTAEASEGEGTSEEKIGEEGAVASTKRLKGRKSRVLKVKKKSDTFEKLGTIGKSVSKEDLKNTSSKISELSGKNKSSITRVLNSDSISQKQVNNIFSNLDKAKITSDVFKDILSDLVSSGKLSKETVSGMLFEYMDKGVIEKSDVAKIMSQLKML